MRKPPVYDRLPNTEARPPGIVGKTYEFELLTPLFGGGVEPGHPDPVTPIRGTSIRGHLRFWWRAAVGARFETVEEMRKREIEIWGSADTPSAVQIEVVVKSQSKPRRWANFVKKSGNTGELKTIPQPVNNTYKPYILFPFQGKLNSQKTEVVSEPSLCIEHLNFELTLTFPKSVEPDVETALKAWANLGGIGARTRRGCGAIYCEELAVEEPGMMVDICKRFLFSIGSPGNSDNAAPKGLAAWCDVVTIIEKFRQGKRTPVIPRNGRTKGRSFWPEPDSIRNITGYSDTNHKKPMAPEKWVGSFPRAVFGLPIVFSFIDGPTKRDCVEDENPYNKDPSTSVLYPDGKERCASPLILRPMKLKSGKVYAIIAQIAEPWNQSVVLKWKKLNRNRTEEEVCSTKHIHPPGTSKPLPFLKKFDALDAFLAFALENHFKEVESS